MSAEKGFSLNLRKKFCPGKVIKHLNRMLKERERETKYEIALAYTDIFLNTGKILIERVCEGYTVSYYFIVKKKELQIQGITSGIMQLWFKCQLCKFLGEN